MKPKTVLLAACFLFTIFRLKAQEKYEYGTISYAVLVPDYYVGFTLNGAYTETRGALKTLDKSATFHSNLVPLIAKTNELEKDGWEVYSTAALAQNLIYNIRKKKN